MSPEDTCSKNDLYMMKNNLFLRLIDLTTRHRAETEMETERLRQAQMQAEKLLDARERAHRQKVKGMEETVSAFFLIRICSFVHVAFLVTL